MARFLTSCRLPPCGQGYPPPVPEVSGLETKEEEGTMDLLAMSGGAATILWLIAVVVVVWGIVTILRGGVLAGVVLVVVGLLIGPGGYSIFKA
jgi:hypothetical protein